MSPSPEHLPSLSRIFADGKDSAIASRQLSQKIFNTIGGGWTFEAALLNLDRMRQEIGELVESAPKNLNVIMEAVRSEVETTEIERTSAGPSHKSDLKKALLLIIDEVRSDRAVPSTLWAAANAGMKPSEGSLIDVAQKCGVSVTLGDRNLLGVRPAPAGLLFDTKDGLYEREPLQTSLFPGGSKRDHSDPLMRIPNK